MDQHLATVQRRHQADHFASPQEVEQVRLAVAAVDDGLGLLARLGHRYHLEPGPPSSDGDPWPRVLFHVEAAPNGRIVDGPQAARELGSDWWPTLHEAQHAEGYRAQMAGRGGIGDRSVPMLLDGRRGPQPDPGPSPRDNSAVIAAWKKENGHADEH